MKLRNIILTICLIVTGLFTAKAYDHMEYHCDGDTALINQLLSAPELKDLAPSQRVALFARKLVGSKSAVREEILEADTTIFTVNAHSFTPLSFISTCIALAQAYETSSAPNWRDFAHKFEGVMYKGGKASDFVSRFLYPSDWIADNIFRGNVEDATLHLGSLVWKKKEKSIDYISHHRSNFKAFENERNLERLKMLEMGFRNHQIPFISNGDITNPARFKPLAKDGDIIFLLTPDFNLDSREMGILVKDGDNIRIIQLSPSKDSVTFEDLPLEHYVKRNIKRIQGARIVRIAQ